MVLQSYNVASGSSQQHSIFNAVNTLQLLLLLPLVGTYLPISVYDFIRSMQTSLINFDFIPYKDSLTSHGFLSKFMFEQEDPYLSHIGIETSSCVVNLTNAASIFCLIILLHLLVAVLYLITIVYK